MNVTEKAPAKLNLGLRILGKRDDGYHDILSIFQTVGLFDELSLTPSDTSELRCTGAHVPRDGDNLVLRAERAFKQRFGVTGSARFSLNKRIPVGAGLGGGSSDAAAAFRGLRRLYASDLPESELRECAAGLGSDIPFLLRGGTAVVSGKGERMTVVKWPFDYTYVIVYPGFGVSTAWAYGSLGAFDDDSGAYRDAVEKLEGGCLTEDHFFGALRNDFETVVFGKYPALRELKTVLLEQGARAALLTGSGSSLYGIFEDDAAALRCARSLKNRTSHVFAVKACS